MRLESVAITRPRNPCPVCGKKEKCPGTGACMEKLIEESFRRKGKVTCPLCGLLIPGPRFAAHGGGCITRWEMGNKPAMGTPTAANSRSAAVIPSQAGARVNEPRPRNPPRNPPQPGRQSPARPNHHRGREEPRPATSTSRQQRMAAFGELVRTAATQPGMEQQQQKLGELVTALASVLLQDD